MFAVDVKFDVKKLTSKLTNIERKVIPAATSSALNKTATKVRNGAVKDLRKIVGKSISISAKNLKKLITIIKANRKKLVATIFVADKQTLLISFNAKQTKKGVMAKPYGRRKLHKGAFIQTMSSGHRGVFARIGGKRETLRKVKEGKHTGKTYYPELKIRELSGPSLVNEFKKAAVMSGVKKAINREFPIIFGRELKFRLSKLK